MLQKHDHDEPVGKEHPGYNPQFEQSRETDHLRNFVPSISNCSKSNIRDNDILPLGRAEKSRIGY